MLLSLCHSFKLPIKILVASVYAMKVFMEQAELSAELSLRSAMAHYALACVYLIAKINGHATTARLPPYASVEAANPQFKVEDLKAAEKSLFLIIKNVAGANSVYEHLKLAFASWFGPAFPKASNLIFRSSLFLLLYDLVADEQTFECNLMLMPYVLGSATLKAMKRTMQNTSSEKILADARKAIIKSCKIGGADLIEAEARLLESIYVESGEREETGNLRALLTLYLDREFGTQWSKDITNFHFGAEDSKGKKVDIEKAECVGSKNATS